MWRARDRLLMSQCQTQVHQRRRACLCGYRRIRWSYPVVLDLARDQSHAQFPALPHRDVVKPNAEIFAIALELLELRDGLWIGDGHTAVGRSWKRSE